jgi:hypothetical protein
MKALLTAALFALASTASIAWGQRAPDPAPPPRHHLAAPADSTRSTAHPRAEPDEAQLLSHRHYRNADGNVVHAPAKTTNAQVPAGASAMCLDGSCSFSRH